MDDEEDGFEVEEEVIHISPLPPARWSWFWFFESLCALWSSIFHACGLFVSEGIGEQMARRHNLKVETDEAKDMARDVLEDLHALGD